MRLVLRRYYNWKNANNPKNHLNKYFSKRKCKIERNKIYNYKILFIIFINIINIITQFIIINTVNYYNLPINPNKKDYSLYRFSIVQRLQCPNCGFFSFYMLHLGCLKKCLSMGYIPIIDLKSFPNAYNNGNTSIINPWENFFYQPYNYTLEEVKLYAKNITFFECIPEVFRPEEKKLYYNKNLINFWHNLEQKYMPLKREIIKESIDIMKALFGNSTNVLGVKMRGTDYISVRPRGHSIQPQIESVISDVKMMDQKYKYDFIFFATEDEMQKKKFVPEFGNKLKLLNPNVTINYDYNNPNMINLNEKIYGNIEYIKNYVLNIIILSKCLDIITTRCNGAAAIFILTNGFRHTKIYNLGEY